MKFYKENLYTNYQYSKIIHNKLNVCYHRFDGVIFFKNGKSHNVKNASFQVCDGYKTFYLNGKYYGYKAEFTKESWRKFVKLKAFL